MNLLKRDFIIREPLLVSIHVLITVVFSALTHAYTGAVPRWESNGSSAAKRN
jgi:hypothetical protein